MANKEKELINPLRNEKVIIRFMPKKDGKITNPNHVNYGGMGRDAWRSLVVPIIESTGQLKNVLTNDEKDFFEDLFGYEKGFMGVYKKPNFWLNRKVMLQKGDNIFDLSVPDDYLKYKICLACDNQVAPSLEEYNSNRKKATYMWCAISPEEELKAAKSEMENTTTAWKMYGKIEDDRDILMFAVESLSGRPVSTSTKIEFLQTQINDYIKKDAAKFLKVVQDKLLPTKVLIKKGVLNGVIAKKGDYLYMRNDNSPLCENGQDPTFDMAAAYVSNPKHNGIKLAIEAAINANN